MPSEIVFRLEKYAFAEPGQAVREPPGALGSETVRQLSTASSSPVLDENETAPPVPPNIMASDAPDEPGWPVRLSHGVPPAIVAALACPAFWSNVPSASK